MIAFVVLACFLFAFALDRSQVPARGVAASLAWLTVLFAATTGAGRTFDAEEEDGAFRHLLLTPVSRQAIFLGKSAANLVLIWIVTILACTALTGFLGVGDPGSLVRHGAVFLPGTIGLAATGTFFGLISRPQLVGRHPTPGAHLSAAGSRYLLRGDSFGPHPHGQAVDGDFGLGETAVGLRNRLRGHRFRPLSVTLPEE